MSLTPLDALAIFAAGIGAGTVNSVAGAGSLVTFPTLLAVGYGTVTANVSNTIGVVPGSVAGSYGYRHELAGRRRILVQLLPWAVVGSLLGGILLLLLPSDVFDAVVPVLVGLAGVLVLLQPWVAARIRSAHERHPRWLGPAVFVTAIYGGYFGAAQGVLLLALLGLGLRVGLHQANGVKNVLAGVVNAVAALYFALTAHVAWLAVLLIAAGSSIGGMLGARYGRRLPAPVFRGIVGVGGIGVAIALALT